MYINLLPRGVRLRIQLRGTLRRWSLIWAATVGCAALYVSTQVRELMEVRSRLELLDTRCYALNQLQGQMNETQVQLTELLAEKRVLEQLKPNDHVLDLLGVLSSTTKPLAGKLRLQRLSLVAPTRQVAGATVPQPALPPGQTAAPQLKPTTVVILQGTADDGESLAQFVLGLRASNVFQRVDLKSSSQMPGGDGASRQYQLECRYEDHP